MQKNNSWKKKINRSLANDFFFCIAMAFSTILNKLKGNCLGFGFGWVPYRDERCRKQSKKLTGNKGGECWKTIKNFSVFHAGNVRLQKDKQNKRTDEDSLPKSLFCPAIPSFNWSLILSTRLSLVSSGLLAKFNFLVELMNFV